MDPEECLARFRRRAAERLPPGIAICGADVSSNLREAVKFKKFDVLEHKRRRECKVGIFAHWGSEWTLKIVQKILCIATGVQWHRCGESSFVLRGEGLRAQERILFFDGHFSERNPVVKD